MFFIQCAIKQAVSVNIYKDKRKYYENFNYKQKLSLNERERKKIEERLIWCNKNEVLKIVCLSICSF